MFSARPFFYFWKMLLEKKTSLYVIARVKLVHLTFTASFLYNEQCGSQKRWCNQDGHLCLCEMKMVSQSVSKNQSGKPKMCMKNEM